MPYRISEGGLSIKSCNLPADSILSRPYRFAYAPKKTGGSRIAPARAIHQRTVLYPLMPPTPTVLHFRFCFSPSWYKLLKSFVPLYFPNRNFDIPTKKHLNLLSPFARTSECNYNRIEFLISMCGDWRVDIVKFSDKLGALQRFYVLLPCTCSI